MGKAAGFSSLKPKLLARKGSARPAMRSAATGNIDVLSASQADLGWNDMGETHEDAAARSRKQQRNTAASEARRAAFTLRLDTDRHLKLKLASTLQHCSAQVLVTEALDRFLEDIPQLDVMAAQASQFSNKA